MPSFCFVLERITRPCNGRDVAHWPAAGAESEPDWFSLPLTESCQHRRIYERHRVAVTHLALPRIEEKSRGQRLGADPGAHGNIM